jgi:hypothetical protein
LFVASHQFCGSETSTNGITVSTLIGILASVLKPATTIYVLAAKVDAGPVGPVGPIKP